MGRRILAAKSACWHNRCAADRHTADEHCDGVSTANDCQVVLGGPIFGGRKPRYKVVSNLYILLPRLVRICMHMAKTRLPSRFQRRRRWRNTARCRATSGHLIPAPILADPETQSCGSGQVAKRQHRKLLAEHTKAISQKSALFDTSPNRICGEHDRPVAIALNASETVALSIQANYARLRERSAIARIH